MILNLMSISKLPRKYKLLKELNSCIQEYFQNSDKTEVANLSQIYEYIKRKEPFKNEFQDDTDFSRFMRQMHGEDVLLQFIPNCSVDTTIYYHYKWEFYPKDTILKDQIHSPTAQVSENQKDKSKIFPKNLKYIASNGEKVRSQQELYIFNQLLLVDSFKVHYERSLPRNYQEKLPDFTIINKNTGKIYYWEHLGLLEVNGEYFDKTLEKLVWYRSANIINIDDGGSLIVTRHENDRQFGYLVKKYIQKIKEN